MNHHFFLVNDSTREIVECNRFDLGHELSLRPWSLRDNIWLYCMETDPRQPILDRLHQEHYRLIASEKVHTWFSEV
jgi:hypothetical protein